MYSTVDRWIAIRIKPNMTGTYRSESKGLRSSSVSSCAVPEKKKSVEYLNTLGKN